jgi:hypothetical protein
MAINPDEVEVHHINSSRPSNMRGNKPSFIEVDHLQNQFNRTFMRDNIN